MDGPTRRGVITFGAVGAAAGLVAGLDRLGSTTVFGRTATGQVAWPSTVGLLPSGGLSTIGAPGGGGPVVVSGSRVVADAVAGTDAVTAALHAEERWLAIGSIPGQGGPFEHMARSALLDLRVMLRPGGALLEAWARGHDAVVTRTAAFGAAALAATGHVDDALDVLTFLARVQQPDGTFFDSYQADQVSSGTPEQVTGRQDRPENAGWVLWAADQALNQLSWRQSRGVSSALRSLVSRSMVKVLSGVGADGLPPPRQGYLNGFRRRLDLATAAPMLAGVQAAVEIEQRIGNRVQTFALAEAALRLDASIAEAFAPGYPAMLGSGLPDESVAFLMPPIGAGSDPGTAAVIRRVDDGLTRPHGVIFPGRNLTRTAPIALVALADSYSEQPGTRARAAASLRWLDRHRTAPGSLPEAVQFNGAPAGPAPWVWTAAIVLLALAGPAGGA